MKAKIQDKGLRNRKQVSGGFLSVSWVKNPELARPHPERVAKAGYSAWFCVVRHMNINLFDDCVKTALKRIAEIAHEYEVKFILDTDPSHWAEDVTTRDPLAALWVITPLSVDVYNPETERVRGKHPESFQRSDVGILYRIFVIRMTVELFAYRENIIPPMPMNGKNSGRILRYASLLKR